MPDNGLPDTREADAGADTLGERILAAARAQGGIDPLDVAFAKERAKAMLLAAPPQAVTLGRYVVVDRIGRGGMGVVYAAYDPDLDRKIALKVLYPSTHRATVEHDERLLREAQALAKLTHPNVVAVYDVGRVGGDGSTSGEVPRGSSIFLAMEYVEGATLSTWIRDANPSIRQIVAVMSGAGRGLAAAHECGIVHRDFKPENVMVGADHRARVMDFGIARQLDAPVLSERERVLGQPLEASGLASGVATPTAGIVGTPAYMAPEQLRGEAVGPAADQFAFCVTMWEALHGQRPFEGDTVVALATAVLDGKRRPPPRHTRIPGWLRRTIDRGLALDPARRWPSMTALLAALAHGETRSRWHRALALVLGLATLGAAMPAIRAFDRERRIAACASEGATIDELWNDEARAQVRSGLLATGLGYATTTADHAIPRLDQRVAAWAAHRSEACMNASVYEAWDDDTRDRVLWCLDERRLELSALISTFAAADAAVVETAVSAAAELGNSARCVAPEAVALLPSAPTTAQRATALELRGELARASALNAAGRYAEGLEILQRARAHAEDLDSPRWAAMVRVLEGAALQGSGARAQSEAATVEAYMAAARAEAWDVAADAATRLVFTVGRQQDRRGEAQDWARHAEAAATLAGDPLELWAAWRAGNLAAIELDAGEYAAAKQLRERSLAILVGVLGPDHPSVADAQGDLATVLTEMGEYERAIEMLERALAVFEEALGVDHPKVQEARSNLATALYRGGKWVESLAMYEQVLAVREHLLGPDHPRTAETLNNIAVIQLDLGNHAAAKAANERALAIRERALGPAHLDVAVSVGNLANVHFDLGDYAGAEVLYQRALAIKQARLRPDHPSIAKSLSGLANTQAELGELDKAHASATRAVAIHEKALGRGHTVVATDLANLGEIELARHHIDEAVALLERAVAVYDATDGVQPNEPLARFALARALVAADGDHARAVGLARGALADYRSVRGGRAATIADIESWLARHSDGVGERTDPSPVR